MDIRVIFSGILSDVTGTRMKTYSDVRSFDDLKMRLFDDFPEIQHYKFGVCHKDEMINAETLLNDIDEITLIPPLTGT